MPRPARSIRKSVSVRSAAVPDITGSLPRMRFCTPAAEPDSETQKSPRQLQFCTGFCAFSPLGLCRGFAVIYLLYLIETANHPVLSFNRVVTIQEACKDADSTRFSPDQS